jgi:hypothetical protein
MMTPELHQAELVQRRFDDYLAVLRKDPSNTAARRAAWDAYQREAQKLDLIEKRHVGQP